MIDQETGEVIESELGDLDTLAAQASAAFKEAERFQLDYARRKAEADDAVARFLAINYPELGMMEAAANAAQEQYDKLYNLLRDEATNVWSETGKKTLLGGAVRVKEVTKTLMFDKDKAIAWAEKNGRRDMLKITAVQRKFEDAARTLPESVIVRRKVPQVSIHTNELTKLTPGE